MTQHQLFGQIDNLHQMMIDLLNSIPEQDAYQSPASNGPSLAWLFGKAMFQETVALREWIQHESDITDRVRAIFAADTPDITARNALPPRDHLLNWALEIQEENLTRLANPAYLPSHPAVTDGRLTHHILRQLSQNYEGMLEALTNRQIAIAGNSYQITNPLRSAPPSTEIVDVSQGHYRIGSQPDDPAAMDNELPPQVVQLSNFRIARRNVTNAEYLSFMQDGGYQRAELWNDRHSPQTGPAEAPRHWQKDDAEQWFGISLNGPFDLIPEAPVTGINRHEAEAYANWASTQGDAWEGAVLQHEYQWEAATRTRIISETGQVWEWCSNAFHPYTDYRPSPDPFCQTAAFDEAEGVLRGGCLHSQPLLKRAAYRKHVAPADRQHFAGIRLVFPPLKP